MKGRTETVPKLKIENLNMVYDDGVSALTNINFEVEEGEFLSVLGPSGCGKTTLLRILIGLLKPTSGTIYKGTKNMTYSSPASRCMGIVFQNYALFENMTVLGNVEYALKIRPENKSKQARKKVRQKALDMLERVGLSEHINKKPCELSGGQQQRVAIARTLIMNPEIILFDEPMAALDVATRVALRSEIKKIQKEMGVTIIYITHDQEEAFIMSDRIIIMKDAEIVQIDTPSNIMKNPKNKYVEDFVIGNIKSKIDALSEFMINEDTQDE